MGNVNPVGLGAVAPVLSGGYDHMDLMTESGVWVKPEGVKRVFVLMISGGNSGICVSGGSSLSISDTAGVCGGGLAGQIASGIFNIETLAAVNVVVGEGAPSVEAAEGTRLEAGASSFGDMLTAPPSPLSASLHQNGLSFKGSDGLCIGPPVRAGDGMDSQSVIYLGTMSNKIGLGGAGYGAGGGSMVYTSVRNTFPQGSPLTPEGSSGAGAPGCVAIFY